MIDDAKSGILIICSELLENAIYWEEPKIKERKNRVRVWVDCTACNIIRNV